ncbi:hypothetical protein Agub_g4477, partial [Astrephomene gubernaculifera]
MLSRKAQEKAGTDLEWAQDEERDTFLDSGSGFSRIAAGRPDPTSTWAPSPLWPGSAPGTPLSFSFAASTIQPTWGTHNSRGHGLEGVAASGHGSSNPNRSNVGSVSAANPTAAGGPGKAGAAIDDDDEETFFERLSNSAPLLRLNAVVDRIFQNYFVAILCDVVGVLLFMFDIYTDALVVKALSQTEHRDWMIATLVFILWHYGLMAGLVAAYLQRTSTKLNVLGLEEGDWAAGGAAAALLGCGRRTRWLLFLPAALPGVAVLDVAMLFTSLLPCMFPRAFANFSSFLSNYNFSRLFIEFVFESIPQTVLQTYIYHRLAQGRHAGSDQQRTVALSLTVSALNSLRYGWKLYKAADDAGLALPEYFKYLLLLKGNYECSPSAMIAVINECCSVRNGAPAAGAAALRSGQGGGSTAINAGSSGSRSGSIGGGGSSSSPGSSGERAGEMAFLMNGFHLHRNKSQYGPAQQAYILLNAFDRIEGCSSVQRWVVSGCPLASMNRILEKGVRAFKNLTTLEVNECALRGDTWKLVTRAIKRHKHLEKVKLIQTGILPKYRNAKRQKVVAGIFKHSLRLRTVALCLHWWGEQYLQTAVELYLLDHPTLESLAIELPPGAPLAARDITAVPRVAAAEQGQQGSSRHAAGAGRKLLNSNNPASGYGGNGVTAGGGNGGGVKGLGGSFVGSYGMSPMPLPLPIGLSPRGRMSDATGGGGGGSTASASAAAAYRTRAGSAGGAAAGFLSPFAADASTADAASGGSRRFSWDGASGVGAGAGGHGIPGVLLGWMQQGSGALSDALSYISGGTVNTLQGLAAVATGQPWSSGAAAASGSTDTVSPRYCWLLASVVASAPALRSLYVHNHALPEAAAEGVGQLAAALAGNTRLTALSLRGSAVGDAGAAALARVLGSGHNSCLQSLNLRKCQLHDEGVSAICACLVDNRGLRCLDLSYNRVQGQHAGGGGGGAGGGPHHQGGGGGVGGGGGGRLAGLERALRLNSGLTELRLEGWRDTFEDAQAVSALAAALAANRGLRSLSLADCCISTQGAAALAAALTANATLTALNLST